MNPDDQSSSSQEQQQQGVLAASTDFILYLVIVVILVLLCFITDHCRRRRFQQEEEAAQQLRQVRREHYNTNRNPTRLAPSNDPEKQKEEILNALILRTVAISDITIIPAPGEEKGNKGGRTQSILTRSSINNKRGSTAPKTLSSSINNNKERKRSILLIRRRTVGPTPGSLVHHQRSLTASANATFCARDIEEGLKNNDIENGHKEDESKGAKTSTHQEDEDESKSDANNDDGEEQSRIPSCQGTCHIQKGGGAASTCCIMPLIDETQEHQQGDNNINVIVSDDSNVGDTATSTHHVDEESELDVPTELLGMLLVEEGGDGNEGDDEKQGGTGPSPSGDEGGGRLADATCSICLLGYEEGDKIAWSRNPKCNHAFHEECLVPWLMKHDECPNCRNNYFIFEAPNTTQKNSEHQTYEQIQVNETTPTILSTDEDEYM